MATTNARELLVGWVILVDPEKGEITNTINSEKFKSVVEGVLGAVDIENISSEAGSASNAITVEEGGVDLATSSEGVAVVDGADIGAEQGDAGGSNDEMVGNEETVAALLEQTDVDVEVEERNFRARVGGARIRASVVVTDARAGSGDSGEGGLSKNADDGGTLLHEKSIRVNSVTRKRANLGSAVLLVRRGLSGAALLALVGSGAVRTAAAGGD